MRASKHGKAGNSKAAAEHRKAIFVEAYIANGENATQAAIAAGLSPKSAERQGLRLSRNVRVAAAIARRRAEVLKRYLLTTERVIRELAPLCFSDVRKLFKEDGSLRNPHELDEETARAVASIEVVESIAGYDKDGTAIPQYTKKIRFWDKNAALEKAMKYLGLFKKDNEQATTERRFIYVPVHGDKGNAKFAASSGTDKLGRFDCLKSIKFNQR
jgi:phage terminase small subunit